jgi:hypothetical protein
MLSSTSKARGTAREPLFFCAICRQRHVEYKISKIKLSISMIVATPATESTKASPTNSSIFIIEYQKASADFTQGRRKLN